MMRRIVSTVMMSFLAMSGWGGHRMARAQEPPGPSTLRPVRTYGTDVPLHPVLDVICSSERVVVLTAPEPAIHVFENGNHREFGRKGRGPGELINPVDVGLDGDTIVVLDAFPGSSRFERWAMEGTPLGGRTLGPLGFVTRFSITGGHTVGYVTDLGRDTYIVRIGPRVDTLASFPMMRVQHVTASEGPTGRYSVPLPFQPAAAWALLKNGDVAIWDPAAAGVLSFVSPAGNKRSTPLPPLHRIRVQEHDRVEWFDDAFPTDFLGRPDDPLRAIRRRARDVIAFPDSFPAVLAMVGDPHGGVWLKRTPASQGEVWMRVGRGVSGSVRFPAGRKVRDFGSRYVCAWAREGPYDVEVVELYRREDVEAAAAGAELPSRDVRR